MSQIHSYGIGRGEGEYISLLPSLAVLCQHNVLKVCVGSGVLCAAPVSVLSFLPQACFFNPVFAQPLSPTLATFLHFIYLPCVNTQTQATLKKNACFQCSVQSTAHRGEVCTGRRLKPMLVPPLQPAGENRESLCSTSCLLSRAGPACE